MLDQPSHMYTPRCICIHTYTLIVCERGSSAVPKLELHACIVRPWNDWTRTITPCIYVLCDDRVQLSMCQGGVSVCAVRVVLSQSCLARTNVCLACETIQTLPYPSLLPHLCKSESGWRVWPPETPPYSAHCNNQGAVCPLQLGSLVTTVCS